MRSVIKTAKTVDDAVRDALNELSAAREDATIEVLEEPSRGLFGLIGTKEAVVRVSVEDNFKEELLRDLRLPYVEPGAKKEREPKPERKAERPRAEKVRKPRPEREVKPQEPKSVLQEEAAPEAAVEEAPTPETPAVPVAPDAPKKEPKERRKPRQKAERPEREPRREKPMPVQHTAEEDPEIPEIVTILDPDENECVALLRTVLAEMDVTAQYRAEKRGNILFITAEEVPEEKAGLIIGRRGETLDAIQYLLSLVAHRKNLSYSRVIVDINDYREKRVASLKQMAHRMARKAIKTNRNMKLEPMNPYERRIVHSEMQQVEGIHTVSEGNEPYRRVIICVNRNK